MFNHIWNASEPRIRIADALIEVTPTFVTDSMPAVPIRMATRLRLEMLVMRRSVLDLRKITDTILRDPGATLQLMRVAADEYTESEDRPSRIEHIVATVNRERWYETVCSSIISSQQQHVLNAWDQFCREADAARAAAMQIDGFCPEEAYLVGMLYQLGKLPFLLGWTSRICRSQSEEGAVGMMLAECWRAPGFLIEALHEQQQTKDARWADLLRAARRDASQYCVVEKRAAGIPCCGPVLN